MTKVKTKAKAVKKNKKEMTVEQQLRALYKLQIVDSKIDRIKTLRGELPLEVLDLEDEVEGFETRITKLDNEINKLEETIASKNNAIIDSLALIKKYEDQQSNVRNNREYDSLSKEIEYQTLEIELSTKKIKEFTAKKEDKLKIVESSKTIFEEMKGDLENKKAELDSIIQDTKKDEDILVKGLKVIENVIEERLITAYKRIRLNAQNGLAIVPVQRDACGGCFNQIPSQRQLDIKSHKKIIVCEYCGRVLVDDEIVEKKKLK